MPDLGFKDGVPAISVILLLLVLAAVWAYLAANPKRALLAWAATVGIQVDLIQFQLGVSDLLALPLALWVVVLLVTRPHRLSGSIFGWLAFAGLFWTFGNLVSVLSLGYLPKWTYLNKDVGLVEMLLCMGAIILLIDSPARLRHLIVTFVAAGSVLNALGLILAGTAFIAGFGQFVIYSGFRYLGFMPNPNAWAFYLAVIALFQLCMLVFGRKEVLRVPPGLQWANVVLLIIGMAVTLSRSGMLAFLFGTACLLFFVPRDVRLSFVRTLSLMGILLAVALWQSGVLGVILRRVTGEGDSGRMLINQAAWDMYTRSPFSALAGIGIGTFLESAALPGYQWELHNTLQIHNTFFWLLVEGGPLMLTLFVLLVGSGIRRAWRITKIPEFDVWGVATVCSLMSCLIFFVLNEGMYQRQFWLLLALTDVLVVLARQPRMTLAVTGPEPALEAE